MMKDLTGIKGQAQAVRQLENAHVNNRISHAYLFLGPEGIGKKAAAYAFTSALHCSQKGPDGKPCRECPACQKMEHGNHPDLHLVEAQGSTIKIEQIREIQAQSAYKQLESKYKVIIIDDAQKMTDEAANCLLKILEEPPKDTVFLLLATSLYAVLPTIISRCQLIRFNSLSPAIVEDILQAEAGIGAHEAGVLSQLSGGSVSQALKIWESWSEDNEWRSPERILEVLNRQDRIELLRLSSLLEKDQYLQPTLEFLLRWFRDLLVWEKTGCAKLVNNQGRSTTSWPEADPAQRAKRAEQAVALLSQALKRLKQNANARLTLDVLFLKLHDLMVR